MQKKIFYYLKPGEFLSLIYSIFFNLKYLPLSIAMKLPIKIHYSTRVKISKDAKFIFEKDPKTFNIKLGYFGHVTVPNWPRSYLIVEGTIIFKGTVSMGRGFHIHCAPKGVLEFGDEFKANKNLNIDCQKNIVFGDKNLVGWNCTIRDWDGHKISGYNSKKPIILGNEVWIAAFCDILKGVIISEQVVIATHSLVTEKITNSLESHCIIAGAPAKIIRRDISWEE